MSNLEIHLLSKYIKSVLWRVAKRLSYIEDARCLKVKSFISEGTNLRPIEVIKSYVEFANHQWSS